MQYEYWNEEKRQWVQLIEMHYHSIKDGRVFMYGNWYAVRPMLNSLTDAQVSDTTEV